MESTECDKPKTNFKLIKETVFEHGLTEQDRNILYDEASQVYDQTVSFFKYVGPFIVAKTIASFYNEKQRSSISILDVGTGTGLVGKELQKFGFAHIDGVDPSKGMIEKTKEKGVYRNLICEALTKDPLDIPAGSYDVISVAGVFGQNHIKCDAIYEMLRLVKQGGHVCIATRKELLQTVDEYKNRFYPLCDELEKSGKWKKIKEERCEYQDEKEGILFCFQKC